MDEASDAYEVSTEMHAGFLVGKRDGLRQLRRSRHEWEDSIKLYFTGVGWKVFDCINLAQARDRVTVVALVNVRGSIKCGEIFG
jgi:hypothetical protein